VRKAFQGVLGTSRRETRNLKAFTEPSITIVKWLAVGAMLLALSFPAHAQQSAKKVPRIGILRSVTLTPAAQLIGEAFLQGLRELGWTEGENVVIEYRYAEGKVERLPDLAAELVGLNVDVIFAGDASAALAAKRATSITPIVFSTLGDPVRTGLVVSLARPGGNLTGLAGLGPELSGKQLELLKEVVPKLTRVALLANPSGRGFADPVIQETEVAARSLAIRLQVVKVSEPDKLEEAFSAMARERAAALMVLADPIMFISQRKRILGLVEKSRLPAIYVETAWVPAGGLMSYAPNLPERYRRVAYYVDKILKGAKPGDLPVEQPTKFELIINLKAAKQIGLTIPPNVLARADRVIK
jgi:putative tryptophan/tyrosine transport system substrate-binding protein